MKEENETMNETTRITADPPDDKKEPDLKVKKEPEADEEGGKKEVNEKDEGKDGKEEDAKEEKEKEMEDEKTRKRQRGSCFDTFQSTLAPPKPKQGKGKGKKEALKPEETLSKENGKEEEEAASHPIEEEEPDLSAFVSLNFFFVTYKPTRCDLDFGCCVLLAFTDVQKVELKLRLSLKESVSPN